eukprot:462322_1
MPMCSGKSNIAARTGFIDYDSLALNRDIGDERVSSYRTELFVRQLECKSLEELEILKNKLEKVEDKLAEDMDWCLSKLIKDKNRLYVVMVHSVEQALKLGLKIIGAFTVTMDAIRQTPRFKDKNFCMKEWNMIMLNRLQVSERCGDLKIPMFEFSDYDEVTLMGDTIYNKIMCDVCSLSGNKIYRKLISVNRYSKMLRCVKDGKIETLCESGFKSVVAKHFKDDNKIMKYLGLRTPIGDNDWFNAVVRLLGERAREEQVTVEVKKKIVAKIEKTFGWKKGKFHLFLTNLKLFDKIEGNMHEALVTMISIIKKPSEAKEIVSRSSQFLKRSKKEEYDKGTRIVSFLDMIRMSHGIGTLKVKVNELKKYLVERDFLFGQLKSDEFKIETVKFLERNRKRMGMLRLKKSSFLERYTLMVNRLFQLGKWLEDDVIYRNRPNQYQRYLNETYVKTWKYVEKKMGYSTGWRDEKIIDQMISLVFIESMVSENFGICFSLWRAKIFRFISNIIKRVESEDISGAFRKRQKKILNKAMIQLLKTIIPSGQDRVNLDSINAEEIITGTEFEFLIYWFVETVEIERNSGVCERKKRMKILRRQIRTYSRYWSSYLYGTRGRISFESWLITKAIISNMRVDNIMMFVRPIKYNEKEVEMFINLFQKGGIREPQKKYDIIVADFS